MTDQTDAEFIAEISSRAENAANDHAVIYSHIALSPKTYELGEASRTAIPRLIGMVEAEKKRADDAEAERDSLRVNAVDDAFVKRIMEMPDAELLASVEPGEIDLNKQLFKTAKMQVERDTALAEVARLREVLAIAKRECLEHNAEYHHRTSAEILDKIDAALASKENA